MELAIAIALVLYLVPVFSLFIKGRFLSALVLLVILACAGGGAVWLSTSPQSWGWGPLGLLVFVPVALIWLLCLIFAIGERG